MQTFKELKPLLVIGDVGLDKYTFGEVSRISPEAPVPILYELDEKCKSQSRRFLGDKDEIASAIDEVANQAKK